jgi:hypothetical protein
MIDAYDLKKLRSVELIAKLATFNEIYGKEQGREIYHQFNTTYNRGLLAWFANINEKEQSEFIDWLHFTS